MIAHALKTDDYIVYYLISCSTGISVTYPCFDISTPQSLEFVSQLPTVPVDEFLFYYKMAIDSHLITFSELSKT